MMGPSTGKAWVVFRMERMYVSVTESWKLFGTVQLGGLGSLGMRELSLPRPRLNLQTAQSKGFQKTFQVSKSRRLSSQKAYFRNQRHWVFSIAVKRLCDRLHVNEPSASTGLMAAFGTGLSLPKGLQAEALFDCGSSYGCG